MLKLTAIGHLGKDAMQNKTQGGAKVINFSVAHTEKWKDSSGEWQEKTIWVECSWWTDKDGIVPYLKKGTQVYVEGSAEVKKYERQDGSTGVSMACRVFSVQLLGGKKESAATTGASEQPAEDKSKESGYKTLDEVKGEQAANDDLPF